MKMVISSKISDLRLINKGVITSVMLLVMMAIPLSAQINGTPDFAPFLLDKRVEREDYNLRLGPVLIDIVGKFGIEFNDNVNTSQNDPIEDVILKPGISFGLKWAINEDNDLDLNIGAEYWHYMDNDELNEVSNQIALSPDTELSYRVLVGDMVFRVYDRIQYSFDSADSVAVDNQGNVTDQDPVAFTRYKNVLGVQSEWFIGETVFAAQLSRTDEWSPDQEFEYIDRKEYKAALNVERDLAANFTVGIGTSYTTIDYDQDINNDGSKFSTGPYFDWSVTELISLYAGVAWNSLDYDTGGLTDGTVYGNEEQPDDLTWNVRLRHTANEVFNHQLESYRAISGGSTSNYNEIDGIRYTASYNVTARVRLDGTVGYEESDSSGGLINDDFDRWIYGLSTELVLGPRLTAEIAYRYIDKSSDAEFQSYEQNQLRIFFKYDF